MPAGIHHHRFAQRLPVLRAAPAPGNDRKAFLASDGEDWRGFPPIARIVDRGDPANKTSDIGAMELYAASVISSDPFRLADALRM